MRIVSVLTLLVTATAVSYAMSASLLMQLPTGARATALEVDGRGALYVAGRIPVQQARSDAYQTDAFVAKIDPAAKQLVYFTRLGVGSAKGLAIDAEGSAYAVGDGPADFPVTIPHTPIPSPGFNQSAFAVKLGSTGNIVYATQFTGAAASYGRGIVVNAAGEAYITGELVAHPSTLDFPATAGAAANVANTGYVVKLNAAGATVLVERGIGGSAIALDALGNIYAAGSVDVNFSPASYAHSPTTPQSYQGDYVYTTCLQNFLFTTWCPFQHVAKLDPSGGTLLYGTFIAGHYGARPTSMAVDENGNVFLAGMTQSTDYPVTPGAVIDTYRLATVPAPPRSFSAPQETGFVTELNAAGNGLVFSTYLGGTVTDAITGIRLSQGQIYVTGIDNSPDFPGLSPMPARCLPDAFVLRVASDGRTLDQVHGIPLLGARNNGIGSSVIALNGQTTVYESGSDAGIYRLDPASPERLPSCATDAGTFQVTRTVAPGQILSLFGTSLAANAEAATTAQGNLPTVLGHRTVSFDGIPAHLFYVSPDQVNVVVPYEIAGRTQTTMTTATDATGGVAGSVPPTAPLVDLTEEFQVVMRNPSVFLNAGAIDSCGGAFSLPTSADYPLARNEDGGFNTCSHPAKPGSVVTFFVNGGGLPNGTAASSGAIATKATPVNVPATAQSLDFSGTVLGSLEVMSFTLDAGSATSSWRLSVRLPATVDPASPLHIALKIDGVAVPSRLLEIWANP